MFEMILQEQQKGVNARLAELRKKKEYLLKAEGIKEQIAKLRTEMLGADREIQTATTEFDNLKKQRNDIITQSVSIITDRMKQILTDKEPVIEINEDGKVCIGLREKDRYTAYAGLSGGEKCEFDLALSLALTPPDKERILILEAAEADPDRLTRLLRQITNITDDTIQVIVNTWYNPESVPEGWKIWQIN